MQYWYKNRQIGQRESLAEDPHVYTGASQGTDVASRAS